jgi:hypothetical protein
VFASVAKEVSKAASREKARFALNAKVVSNIFGKATKFLPSHMLYVARQEGFEEMAEELFQDGVKQVASAYGALINNANEAGKGRYLQYLMMVILKMLQSVTSGAGAIGGPWV